MKNLEDTITRLKEHKGFVDGQYQEKQMELQELYDLYEKCVIRIDQLKYNFETIIYIFQGQVEVP